MHQFWHTITKIKNSSLYKFKLDKKQCIINVEVFYDILQICPRLPNQEFDAPPSDEEIVTFIKNLGTKVTLNLSQMWLLIKCTNHGEPLLQSSTSVYLGKLLVLIRSDSQEYKYYRIDNRDHKKQEKIYYPRFTKVIIHHFISKDTSIFMRNKICMHTVRDDSVLGTLRFVSKSNKYQVYGALLPEGMSNQQMRDSLAYKTYIALAIGAATPKKARKFKKLASPSKKKTLVAVEEPETLQRELLQENKVHDEPKDKSIDTSEGTGLKPGVTDVSKANSSKSEYVSWGESDDDNDDDDQQSDDERTKSNDDDKAAIKTDDEEEDEFIHTPDDYVPTDDENINDEEFERINKEMYSDVNVEFKDLERESEGIDNEEMTDVGQVDAEHENVSHEVVGDQDKDDVQTTITASLATQKTKFSLQSSSISSDYAAKFLNFDDIPSGETEIISMMDIKIQHEDPTNSTTLTAIHQRLSDMENEVKTLRNVDHSSAIPTVVKSEVLTIVKEYLETSLDDALHKALQRHTVELVKEHSILADATDSILDDEDVIDKGVADKLKKRKSDDTDRDKDPPARPDQGLKRRKIG
ncbi:hypothetical protein Tco_0603957, partial [Tanacetum coccineum]